MKENYTGHFEKESDLSASMFLVAFILFFYMTISAVYASYVSERDNKSISLGEYIDISINLPALAFAHICLKISEELQNSEPIFSKCVIGCERLKNE